jgi:hypothetical protein
MNCDGGVGGGVGGGGSGGSGSGGSSSGCCCRKKSVGWGGMGNYILTDC